MALVAAVVEAYGGDEDDYWELIFELEHRSEDYILMMAVRLMGSDDAHPFCVAGPRPAQW